MSGPQAFLFYGEENSVRRHISLACVVQGCLAHAQIQARGSSSGPARGAAGLHVIYVFLESRQPPMGLERWSPMSGGRGWWKNGTFFSEACSCCSDGRISRT